MQHTLLFGNGFNRLSPEYLSWEEMLSQVNSKDDRKLEIPNTMIYETKLLSASNQKTDRLNELELEIKSKICEKLKHQKGSYLYKVIYELNFTNYLTTNYDDAFLKTLDVQLSSSDNSEKLYSIRRHKKFENKTLWNIHGEMANQKSIMIGLDHYCGYIEKISSYIKGSYEHIIGDKKQKEEAMDKKISHNTFTGTSWVELFFNSHIHIIGLSLDYSEIDLWWILNKRSRMMKSNEAKITNKIYFYTSKIDPSKRTLLESFNVIVIEKELKNKNYERLYKDLINEMNMIKRQ